MGTLINKSAVRGKLHQNKFRISGQNLCVLEKELSRLVGERLERIMRSAKVSGRKNLRKDDWKR